MMKTKLGRASAVIAAFALAFALTLVGCRNPAGPGYVPAWPPEAGLWHADTRQRVEYVDANDVSGAVNYVNENPGAFVLAIDDDVSTPGSTICVNL